MIHSSYKAFKGGIITDPYVLLDEEEREKLLHELHNLIEKKMGIYGATYNLIYDAILAYVNYLEIKYKLSDYKTELEYLKSQRDSYKLRLESRLAADKMMGDE